MREMRIRLRLKGQGLPEVLTSMLLLGILMMVGYTAMQGGMGISSPLQREGHVVMLTDAVWEGFAPGTQEQEVKGRLLKRKIIRLDPVEPVFQVEMQCFVGVKLVAEQKYIIRKNKGHE